MPQKRERKRSNRVEVRFSDAEFKELYGIADELRLTLADTLRLLVRERANNRKNKE